MSEQALSREDRDALIVQLKGEGVSQTEIGQRVGLSGTRVGRILNGTGGGGIVTVPRPRTEHRCATPGCGAVLTAERWIFSSHTGDRYCYPNEGCWLWSEKKQKAMRVAHVAPKPESVEETS